MTVSLNARFVFDYCITNGYISVTFAIGFALNTTYHALFYRSHETKLMIEITFQIHRIKDECISVSV